MITKDGVPIVAATAEDALLLARAVAAEAAADERKARKSLRVKSGDNGAPPPDSDRDAADRTDRTPVPPAVSAPAQTLNGGSRPPAPRSVPAALTTYMARLQPTQRELIRVIAGAVPEIGLTSLTSAAHMESKRATSIQLSACARMAKKLQLDWSKIVEYRIVGTREARTAIYYKPGPLLRGEAV